MTLGSDSIYHLNIQSANNSRGTSYFQDACDLSFTNTSFVNVHGDYYASEAVFTGLASLHQQIPHGAMFDSAARYSSGKCHPGTRKQIIDAILAWINDPSPDETILWLHGSAGVGKSSIRQTIAEILNDEQKNRYAASFFFANGIDGRQEGSALIPTLAFQIAVNFPGMRAPIEEAMDRDISLPTKSMSVQMKSLLVDPFIKSTVNVLQHTPTILIDGLDECQGSAIQCQLLSLIAGATILNCVPLRFIIASRPEYWIKNAFEGESLRSTTKRMSLNPSDLVSTMTVNSDMATYLRESFDNIYANSSAIMGDVEPPWPSSTIIHRLVYEASGQFIYASTVLKFVGHSSDYCNPVKQLDIILTDSPSRSLAFSELDRLYSRILSVYPRPESLKTVLGGVLLRLRPPRIQNLLGIEGSELIIALNSLSSVIHIQESPLKADDKDVAVIYSPRGSRTTIKFCHQSFIEYLSDSRRSNAFSVDVRPLRDQIAATFFQSIEDDLNGQIGYEELRDENYYHSIASVITDPAFGLRRLSPLLRSLRESLLTYVASTTTFISRPATLLRALNCIQRLISRNLIAGFHDVVALLKREVYPKIVHYMYSSGNLRITDNLVYFSSPIANLADLHTLSELVTSNVLPPKTFLIQNAGIIGVSYVPPQVGGHSNGTGCYTIEPYIREVLENGTEQDLQIRYRLQYIDIALRCICYILEDSDQATNELHTPYLLISTFLDISNLSDIRSEQDLANINFVSFINKIMDMGILSQLHLGHQWRSLLSWRMRQHTNPHIMSTLDRHIPSLSQKIRAFVDHTVGTLKMTVNGPLGVPRYRENEEPSESGYLSWIL